MLEIKGVLDKIEHKDNYVRVNISGLWMTAWAEKFPEFPFEEGDYVEGIYIEKPNKNKPEFPYLNLETLEKKDKPKGWDEKQEIREIRIIRQACFKAACDAYAWDPKKETDRQAEIIVELAQAGEDYILGKKDSEEIEEESEE